MTTTELRNVAAFAARASRSLYTFSLRGTYPFLPKVHLRHTLKESGKCLTLCLS